MTIWDSPPPENLVATAGAVGDPLRHREGLLALAHQAVSAGDRALALRYADRARRLSPRNPPLFQLCARCLMQLGHPREGLAMLARADDLDGWAAQGLGSRISQGLL